jgi:hypothetical protein
MIFVSYSHEDDKWRERFLKMSSPLVRYWDIEFWSDKKIKAGEDWHEKICSAMSRASIAVLLVSDNFLDSDFIANEELPFLLAEAAKKKVTILWVLITPCLWEKTRLKHIQAFYVNELKPLMDMSEHGWKDTLCKLARRIDELERVAETPVVNPALNGRALKQTEPKLQVLAKPARREVEVLVYSGNKKWYAQRKVAKGSMTADCWIGDEKHTKPGDTFKIIAITRDGPPLKVGSSHLDIPWYRSKSAELTVKRA